MASPTPLGPLPPADRHAPVEALQHDGVLRAQVVGRQGAGLPAEALVGVGQVLRPGDVCAELKGGAGRSAWPPHAAGAGVGTPAVPRGGPLAPRVPLPRAVPGCWPAAGGGTTW